MEGTWKTVIKKQQRSLERGHTKICIIQTYYYATNCFNVASLFQPVLQLASLANFLSSSLRTNIFDSEGIIKGFLAMSSGSWLLVRPTI